MGSRRVARRAGRKPARKAKKARSKETEMKVSGVGGLNANEKRSEEARAGESGEDAEDESDGGETQAVRENVTEDDGARGAEGHADADVARALSDDVREHAVDADGRKRESDDREDGEKKSIEVRGGQSSGNFLLHGGEIVDRNARSDGRDCGAKIVGGKCGVASAENDVHGAIEPVQASARHLFDGEIEHGHDFLVEALGANVTYDADDFMPNGIEAAFGTAFAAGEALADGIFVGPHGAGESFVNDGDESGGAKILRGEIAAGFERDANCVEIAGRDDLNFGVDEIDGIERLAFGEEAVGAPAVAHGHA